MTCAVADILLNQKPTAQTLKEWVLRDYPIVGGYGQRMLQWVLSESFEPYFSCGNGAAMRVSSAAWPANSRDELMELADRVTLPTHNHPEGIKAARATALAIWMARSKFSAQEIKREIEHKYGYDLSWTVQEIRVRYRHIELSQYSVPEAISCALQASSFEDAIRNAVSLGGDADTQAAIAGSIAEPLFGLTSKLITRTWEILPFEMRGLVLAVQALSKQQEKANNE